MADALLPIVVLEAVVAAIHVRLLVKRRLIRDLPLGLMMASLAVMGIISLASSGHWSDYFTICTTLACLVLHLSGLPFIFAHWSMMARIQGRYRASARWGLAYYILQPGADAWWAWKSADLIDRVQNGSLSAIDAIKQCPKWKNTVGLTASLISEFPVAVYAACNDWTGLLESSTKKPFTVHGDRPPDGESELIVRGLCEIGCLSEAQGLVEAWEKVKNWSHLSIAYHNRSRIIVLAFLGEQTALESVFHPSSTISDLFSDKERQFLLSVCKRHICHSNIEEWELLDSIVHSMLIEARLPHSFTNWRSLPMVVLIPVVLNTFIFAISAFGGDTWNPEYLIQIGGMQGEMVWDGQWWRLFSAMWLHAGAIHFFSNQVFMISFGDIAARLVGARTFIFVYLVSGLVGNLAVLLTGESRVLVGASGAIFGVFGAAMVAVCRARQYVPKRWFENHLGVLIITFILNFYLSIAVVFISFHVHAWGFIAGSVLTCLLFDPKQRWIPIR